jgi:hypothetical protein
MNADAENCLLKREKRHFICAENKKQFFVILKNASLFINSLFFPQK